MLLCPRAGTLGQGERGPWGSAQHLLQGYPARAALAQSGLLSAARGERREGRAGDRCWLPSPGAAAGAEAGNSLHCPEGSQQLQRTETRGEQPRNPQAWPGLGNDSPLASSPSTSLPGQGIPPPCKAPARSDRGCTWSCQLGGGSAVWSTQGRGLILPHTVSHRGSALSSSHLCFPPLLAVIPAPGESLGRAGVPATPLGAHGPHPCPAQTLPSEGNPFILSGRHC